MSQYSFIIVGRKSRIHDITPWLSFDLNLKMVHEAEILIHFERWNFSSASISEDFKRSQFY